MTTDATRERWAAIGVIAALWAMVFSSSSQVMIMAPILPRIHDELDVSAALSGLVVSGYALALAVTALVIGPISDRFGRRAVLLWGSGSMVIALALHVFAVDVGSLLAVRVLAGIAGGVLTGSAVSFIGDYFPYERRGWANGWAMSGFAVGQVLGIPAGTLLAARHGFAAPFLLFAVTMAIAFLLVLVIVPRQHRTPAAPLTIASGLAEYAALLSSRRVRGAAFVYATMFFAVSHFVLYLPTWAETDLDMGPESIALMFTVGGIASVVFGPLAGKFSDRIGRRPLILASCIGAAIQLALTTVLVHGATTAYLMFFVAMVLLAMRLSPLQALLSTLVPDTRRGALMSLVVALGQLGGALGAAVAGWLFAESGYATCTIVAAVAILTTGWVVWQELPEPSAADRA